jgi:hypothetical protein
MASFVLCDLVGPPATFDHHMTADYASKSNLNDAGVLLISSAGAGAGLGFMM